MSAAAEAHTARTSALWRTLSRRSRSTPFAAVRSMRALRDRGAQTHQDVRGQALDRERTRSESVHTVRAIA